MLFDYLIKHSIFLSLLEAQGRMLVGAIQENNNVLLLDINVKNKNGYTPLILAAENEDVEMVSLLLRQGADVDELNDDGIGAYHVTDNNGILNLLIKYE